MPSFTAADVKRLRELTGAGMLDCKNALTEADGDIEAATEILRVKYAAKVDKKAAERTAGNGLVVRDGSALVELKCETDFVAKNEEFKQLGKDICMHITMANPKCVRREEISAEVIEREKAIYREQVKGKPENIVEKIIEGKLEKFYAESCLLEQPFIKDDSITVGEMLKNMIAKMGENMEIKRFTRLEVGK